MIVVLSYTLTSSISSRMGWTLTHFPLYCWCFNSCKNIRERECITLFILDLYDQPSWSQMFTLQSHFTSHGKLHQLKPECGWWGTSWRYFCFWHNSLLGNVLLHCNTDAQPYLHLSVQMLWLFNCFGYMTCHLLHTLTPFPCCCFSTFSQFHTILSKSADWLPLSLCLCLCSPSSTHLMPSGSIINDLGALAVTGSLHRLSQGESGSAPGPGRVAGLQSDNEAEVKQRQAHSSVLKDIDGYEHCGTVKLQTSTCRSSPPYSTSVKAYRMCTASSETPQGATALRGLLCVHSSHKPGFKVSSCSHAASNTGLYFLSSICFLFVLGPVGSNSGWCVLEHSWGSILFVILVGQNHIWVS